MVFIGRFILLNLLYEGPLSLSLCCPASADSNYDLDIPLPETRLYL